MNTKTNVRIYMYNATLCYNGILHLLRYISARFVLPHEKTTPLIQQQGAWAY